MNEGSALITGASSGIGRELALALAARGTLVVVAARRADKLVDLVATIEAAGGRARALVLDVASAPEQVIAAVQAVDDEVHGLDLVVANAGIGQARSAKRATWADVGPVLQTNLIGAIATLCAVIPRMVERGRGHVVGVSSLAGYRGLPAGAAYSASKAALSTYLEGARVDLRGTNVHVTDVRPGFIETPMTESQSFVPLRMTADAATRRILRAIDDREAVAAFPLPLRAALSASRLLPYRAYDALVSQNKGRRDK